MRKGDWIEFTTDSGATIQATVLDTETVQPRGRMLLQVQAWEDGEILTVPARDARPTLKSLGGNSAYETFEDQHGRRFTLDRQNHSRRYHETKGA